MKRLMQKNRGTLLWGLVIFLVLFVPGFGFAQESARDRIQGGIELYGQGRWREAVLELRRAQAEAPTREIRGEALFWISLAQLSAGEFEEALRDMDALEAADPRSFRLRELPYHRGRALFHLNRFDEAIIVLVHFANSFLPGPSGYLNREDSSMRAAALYWIGESLFSLGQIDRAQEIFRQITEEYPGSAKYEAAVFRLALIEQKRVELELLALLRWSHEEALRNMEEFQRRESFYDQALNAYQRRISELLGGSGGQDRLIELENENLIYQARLASAEERIRSLETSLRELNLNMESPDQAGRLQSMRTSAEELERIIQGTN